MSEYGMDEFVEQDAGPASGQACAQNERVDTAENITAESEEPAAQQEKAKQPDMAQKERKTPEKAEDIIKNGDPDELDELKIWLFKENIRVESEKRNLQELYLKFLEEKKQFQEEMKTLNQKVLAERKRLKEDELFFDKKMEILKSGFSQLEQDKKRLEKERIRWESEIETKQNISATSVVKLFFNGVSSPMTLKKRYKDLIKIFHPDNLCGDTDTIQMINKEYELLKEEYEWQKKA